MKFKLLFLLATSAFLLSNRGGFNNAASGDPKSNGAYCNQCHSGGNFGTLADITLTNESGDTITAFKPGQTYTITIRGGVSDTANSPKFYGFQMVALDTTSNGQAGTFSELGTDVRTRMISGASYIMQSKPREDGTFTAKWTAPEEVDALKFYIAMLAANGNGNTNGDRAIATSFLFEKDLSSDLNDTELVQEINIFPNPATNAIKFASTTSGKILDMNGGIVIDFVNTTSVDISYLAEGQYVVKIGQTTKRFIKI